MHFSTVKCIVCKHKLQLLLGFVYLVAIYLTQVLVDSHSWPGTLNEAQNGLRFMLLLFPETPEYWNYRYVPPCLAVAVSIDPGFQL